jgi:hypothetical protein
VTGAILFGLGYRARSGKDTAAAEMKKQRGDAYKIDIIPFAKALKQEVNAAALAAGGMEKLFINISPPEWVQLEAEPDMTDPLCPFGKFRKFLQWWGSEFRRAENPRYWLDKHAASVEESTADIILVPDLRFPNEMAYILEQGEAVRVDRDDLPPATHISETALADATDWSLILDNNGTLEEFKEGAVVAFDTLITNFP